MHRVRPIHLNHRHRLRLRRLTRADLPGLQWLEARRPTRRIEALVGADILAELLERAPGIQVGVDLDHRLIGALVAAPSVWRPQSVAQPWDRLDEPAPALEIDPQGSVIVGAGALWLDVLSDDQISQVLTVGRKAVVQQLGLDATVSVVEAADWPQWRAQMSAEAYVQQVHAGGFGDTRLRLLIASGWVVRGFWERSESLEVVMWWGNRVR